MVVYSFCHCCRSPLDENNLLTVDSSTSDVFCSETCITEFYDPEIAMFASLEDQFRQSLALNEEDIVLDQETKTSVFNQTLISPDTSLEFLSTNGKKYFFSSKKFNEGGIVFYQAVVFSKYSDKPSFVFNHFLTKSEKLILKYGESSTHAISGESSMKEIEIPPAMLEQTQLKKSQYLAELLTIHNDELFPIEEFELYAKNAIKTIEDADEIFEVIDDDGDTIHTYIKSFSEKGHSFFYVSINMLIHDDEIQKGADILIPILGFPSNDKSVYRQYAQGKKIKEILKS